MKFMSQNSRWLKSSGLIFILAVLICAPFWFSSIRDLPGTDEQASQAIMELENRYQPWFQPLWKPQNKALENMLFALQAAVGAAFLGYYIYLKSGRLKK